jgi:hypothetical protein
LNHNHKGDLTFSSHEAAIRKQPAQMDRNTIVGRQLNWGGDYNNHENEYYSKP